MKKLALTFLLVISMPSSYAADTGGSNPAPAATTAPAPTATRTPTPTPSPTPSPTTPAAVAKTLSGELATIRALIAKKDFTAALAALKIADKDFPNNADVNNLLGYSARNLKQYKPAATYYTKALKIDPKHLGALEYQGELFMLTKKTADAKKNLAKLKSLCGVNCEEYLDLKRAIGNK
ncbi:MAG: tetratricopeptide repeat protein [Candidatus Nanopelagicaceae bacterium]|nr:tetratricopeptide repeat protein [Candidatus Nanopelagicaceae bacterium]